MSSGIPFAPLSLTLDQHQHCQDIAFQLLDRTLRNYDERNDSKDPHTGLPRHHSNLDSVNWKRLRTRANTSLYSERTSSLPRGHHFPLHDGSWNNPCALLAVGTIDSTLDEVMFGLETPDFLTMQVRSAMLGKQSVDGAILSRLAGPTDTDPFQFMGITWMAEKQGWPLSMVIRPRDFTIISATGVVRRPNGDRIGYEVAQSIDLPQCPPLPAPMVRGKLMYGAVYKQLDNGTVDVYINMYVESQGRVLNKLVAAAMWESALGFWKAPQLSETKKLQWCMENKSDTRQKRAAVTHDDSDVKATHCEVCSKKRNLQSRRHSTQHYNDRTACSLCATPRESPPYQCFCVSGLYAVRASAMSIYDRQAQRTAATRNGFAVQPSPYFRERVGPRCVLAVELAHKIPIDLRVGFSEADKSFCGFGRARRQALVTPQDRPNKGVIQFEVAPLAHNFLLAWLRLVRNQTGALEPRRPVDDPAIYARVIPDESTRYTNCSAVEAARGERSEACSFSCPSVLRHNSIDQLECNGYSNGADDNRQSQRSPLCAVTLDKEAAPALPRHHLRCRRARGHTETPRQSRQEPLEATQDPGKRVAIRRESESVVARPESLRRERGQAVRTAGCRDHRRKSGRGHVWTGDAGLRNRESPSDRSRSVPVHGHHVDGGPEELAAQLGEASSRLCACLGDWCHDPHERRVHRVRSSPVHRLTAVPSTPEAHGARQTKVCCHLQAERRRHGRRVYPDVRGNSVPRVRQARCYWALGVRARFLEHATLVGGQEAAMVYGQQICILGAATVGGRWRVEALRELSDQEKSKLETPQCPLKRPQHVCALYSANMFKLPSEANPQSARGRRREAARFARGSVSAVSDLRAGAGSGRNCLGQSDATRGMQPEQDHEAPLLLQPRVWSTYVLTARLQPKISVHLGVGPHPVDELPL
ncbi:hypothetical protein ON010_g4803 [Phytophthora cinnamomi]|nr:hypothetical protein ON010_g4803 [Phytophthora cinnamomi]